MDRHLVFLFQFVQIIFIRLGFELVFDDGHPGGSADRFHIHDVPAVVGLDQTVVAVLAGIVEHPALEFLHQTVVFRELVQTAVGVGALIGGILGDQRQEVIHLGAVRDPLIVDFLRSGAGVVKFVVSEQDVADGPLVGGFVSRVLLDQQVYGDGAGFVVGLYPRLAGLGGERPF